MFETGARLFARGTVGALAAGFVNTAAILILARPASAPLMTSWNVASLIVGTSAFGLVFAPLTIFVLPLTWLAFRRSRYRPTALLGVGLLGGIVWSIEILSGDIWLASSAAVGALSGLGAASCFLGLAASVPPARSDPLRQTEASGDR